MDKCDRHLTCIRSKFIMKICQNDVKCEGVVTLKKIRYGIIGVGKPIRAAFVAK